ncbi:response regulator transcription factor [Weissella thailandensis]|uniref:DNA-binding response regulator n=1 Tax=Weissella thailandensis TaxID=89061 RepID=A0ABX9I9K8_9LACO|nr:response regulator transcription factor [Weissella thailandensis]NKY90097.1 response regulator transcription factor [Weissella thailandensis]RDS60174.1 DNA-binding response regulator [Weissella thailandensis]GEP75015.1 DNA-binding response regulator [Weissella thailandensis]
MTKVLVVDDEPSLQTLLTYNLKKSGFDVILAEDGQQALDILHEQKIDIVLLDIMLPEKSGVDVTRELRAEKNQIPIIMLTALDDEIDKVVGLEIGADDYVTKPFSPREVIARVHAVLRRFSQKTQAPKEESVKHNQSYGRLTIDFNKMVVQFDDEIVKLTPKEYELLAYMAEREGRVLSRETILDGVWGYEFSGPDTRMVDMHLSHLRDKIELDPKHPVYLKTVRGFGYRFDSSRNEQDSGGE